MAWVGGSNAGPWSEVSVWVKNTHMHTHTHTPGLASETDSVYCGRRKKALRVSVPHWLGMPHLHKEEFQVLLHMTYKGKGSLNWPLAT